MDPVYLTVKAAYSKLTLTGSNDVESPNSLTPILLTRLLFVLKFGIIQVYQEYPVVKFAGTSCVLNKYLCIKLP